MRRRIMHEKKIPPMGLRWQKKYPLCAVFSARTPLFSGYLLIISTFYTTFVVNYVVLSHIMYHFWYVAGTFLGGLSHILCFVSIFYVVLEHIFYDYT